MPRDHTAGATALGAVSILLWSALGLLTTLTRGVPPFETLALSFAVPGIAGPALLALRGRAGLTRLVVPPAAWVFGFIGLFGYHALYFLALNNAPPAEAGLIAYLWPVLIVLLSAGLPGATLRARHIAGTLLGLAGTALLLWRGGAGAAPGVRVLGDVAAAGCALVWSGYSVLNRRFAAQPSAAVGGICAGVALAGALCTFTFESPVVPDTRQGVALLVLGTGPVGAAFFAWDRATKHGNLPLLGALSYLAPLVSTLLLIAAGRAEPSASLLAAAGLTVAGAVIASR